MTSPKSDDNLKLLYDELMPALAKAAVGDFKSDLEINAANDRRVNELVVGVQVLLDVINEKMGELEQAKLKVSKTDRITLLDEVLKKSSLD